MNKRAMTRGLGLLLAAITVIPAAARAQTRIDNPRRALAKDAGRVVELEEVLRIRDDGETAVFKSPRHFKFGPDGSLYFFDFAEGERIYRYSRDGELIAKLLKAGQGPGECQHLTNYILMGDRVRALAWAPPKIMDFTPDGRYLRETRVQEHSQGLWFLGTAGGRIYGIRDELFLSAAFHGEGVFTVPNGVYGISPDFRAWTKIAEFPIRMMIKKRNAFRLDPIDAAISGTTLYVNHAAEYRVTEIDLSAGTVKRIITRAYDRVRAKPAKPSDEDPETRGVELPEDPFVWDIFRIQAAAGKLWVFTSVMKPGGNDNLVDVFDADGRYIDSVILRYPASGRDHRVVARWSLLSDDGVFVIPEQEEDGLVSIGQYRIPDAGLFPSQTGPKREP